MPQIGGVFGFRLSKKDDFFKAQARERRRDPCPTIAHGASVQMDFAPHLAIDILISVEPHDLSRTCEPVWVEFTTLIKEQINLSLELARNRVAQCDVERPVHRLRQGAAEYPLCLACRAGAPCQFYHANFIKRKKLNGVKLRFTVPMWEAISSRHFNSSV